jgi:hypothetical protein
MPDTTQTDVLRAAPEGTRRLSPSQLAAVVKAAYILDAVRR